MGALFSAAPASAQPVADTATATTTPTVTATATASPTWTVTETPTASPSATVTSTPTVTESPTQTPIPTETPAGGITLKVSPKTVRLRPGETGAVEAKVDWNPTNALVTFSHVASDATSAPITKNSTWSPAATLRGTGTVQLVIGTSSAIVPGVYSITITAKTPIGTTTSKVSVEVSPSTVLFDEAVIKQNEYQAFGPEISPPYRGGDSFFYQPRINALLQWRPELNTYYFANTSELLDLSAAGPAHYRLPVTIVDDGSGGDWNQAVETRFAWMTDPVIRSRFLQPPPNVFTPWDVNGSITMYGLPVSPPTQIGPYVVQRFQRAVFRHWLYGTPSHPEWRDTVAVIPLQQAVINFMPEIDPIAAGQIVEATRAAGIGRSAGYWEIDGSAANGFASVVLESDDPNLARISIGNPTSDWVEATLLGPMGTFAQLAPDQSIVSDWPGLPPLSWILAPGERMVLLVHPNKVHPNLAVQRASVTHLWVRPTSRSAMARIAKGMASVALPEAGDLRGTRLTAYYRSLLSAASRSGAGGVGCLVALDGDVNVGDETSFALDLACAAEQPATAYAMAEAAAAIGVGVDPAMVFERLDPNALSTQIGPDPAAGWFWWGVQLSGKEPGGRVRISRTGSAAE